jgi:hypothetical protein
MKCNFCETDEAAYDGKTIYGPWAFMCHNCFEAFGVGLGLGKGQKLETESKTKKGRKSDDENRRKS